MSVYNLITIIGPTASGKTALSVALAHTLHSEIISADSRQLYRGMDLGTGKDLKEYQDQAIPYHLIDIVDPGYKYNLFEYQRDFLVAYNQIRERDKTPILCGGTGLYVESVLKGYELLPVPEDPALRESLLGQSLETLKQTLQSYKTLHNTTDVDSCKRAIRAIEIEEHYRHTERINRPFPAIKNLLIGVDIDREARREKISHRLLERLKQGLVEEVAQLLQTTSAEDLIYYGLEYKYLTLYLTGKLTYQEMVHQLEIAIHQFAKRQMTWFRGMERRGFTIHWLKAETPTDQKLEQIIHLLTNTEA